MTILNIKLSHVDIAKKMRFILTIAILITIVQKLWDPQQYENLSQFLSLLQLSILGKHWIKLQYIYWISIIWEFLIILGIQNKYFFNTALMMGFFLITLGIISSVFGIKSNCGCGLFGEKP